MKAECAATIFHVENVERSIEYYTAVLDFKLDFRYNDLAGVEYDGVLIYLSGPGQDLKKKVGEGSIYIFCDEVDEYFRSICLKGALQEIPIDDRIYEMRDFGIKDYDGNSLSFGTKIDAAKGL